MKYIKKQQGFTLVTVMILSSIAGVVVLSSLKDNTNQERLSGNFEKGLNARLESESGIYNTINEVSLVLAANPTITADELVSNVGNNGLLEASNAANGTSYSATLSQEPSGLFSITSTGNKFESQAVIKANFAFSSVGGSSPFQNAIVGCDGVDLTGSGAINSYDSNEGNYTDSRSGNEGDIRTINHEGADVVLGGGNAISGDVNATGDISTNSSVITGDLHASGDVTIRDSGRELVSGNLFVGGDFNLGASSVTGNVNVNGNINVTNYSGAINNNSSTGGTVLYGGSGSSFTGPSTFYNNEIYNQNPGVQNVTSDDPDADGFDPTNPDTNCDYLAITAEVDGIDDNPEALIALDNGATHGNANFIIEPAGVVGSTDFISENANFLGENTDVIKLDSLSLTSGGTVNIQGGDVTLFVENDFVLGGSTQVTIADGSSLTLIVKGEVELGAGANIIAVNQGVVEASGLPVVSIYSSFSGNGQGNNVGVSISGALSTYAAIYAPLTNAEITQGTQLFGTVRAKDVSVTGNAQVHYDVALRDANGGGGNAGGVVAFNLIGFEY